MLRGEIIETNVNHIIVEYFDDFGRKKHITIGNKYLRFTPEVSDSVTVYKNTFGYKVLRDGKSQFNIWKSFGLYVGIVFSIVVILYSLSYVDRIDFRDSNNSASILTERNKQVSEEIVDPMINKAMKDNFNESTK